MRCHAGLIVAIAAVAVPVVARAQVVAPDKQLSLPPHPRLLLTAADLSTIRSRAEKMAGPRELVAQMRARCMEALAKPVELPDRGGQWGHWYVCPKHGARLRTESPTRHVCPIDGEVYTGYPYDDVVISSRHGAFANDARDCALLFALTGERRWADHTRAILLAYAERYRSYKLHTIRGEEKVGGGRVMPQTLDEAVWLIPMAQATDLVWDTLTPADIEKLRTGLFYPAAVDVIEKHHLGIHNIQCWKNTAVALVGLLFGDRDMVSRAIDGGYGFVKQMAKGIDQDGAWYEGAWGYHFYTMSAMTPLVEACRNCGLKLDLSRYRMMFTVPLEMAMPDGTLPAFNDSAVATAIGNANYEAALAWFGDPILARAITPATRRSLQALVHGVENPPKAGVSTIASHNFPVSGYAVLVAGRGVDLTWLCLKYGPHGGGHGHPDKCSFVLYASGAPISDDPGLAPYGAPVHGGWYRTTVAHNTLVVDEKSQEPATGECLTYHSGGGWSGALVDAGAATAPVRFRRAAVALPGGVAVFLDTAVCTDNADHTLDLVAHVRGAWGDRPAGEAVALPKKLGYEYLRDMRSSRSQDFRGTFTAPDGKPGRSIVFAGEGDGTEYWTGTGVGANTEDRVPVVIARRKAREASWAWAIGGKGVTPVVERVPVDGGAAMAVRVQVASRSWLVVSNPDGAAVRAGGWSGTDRLMVKPIRK